MKYRKKPVVIEAKELLYNRETQNEICEWCKGKLGPDGGIYIETLEGRMYASTGDYVIQGVGGEFYPCKPDIFEKTYELVAISKTETTNVISDGFSYDTKSKQFYCCTCENYFYMPQTATFCPNCGRRLEK